LQYKRLPEILSPSLIIEHVSQPTEKLLTERVSEREA
jgi:hypothetical protein